MSHFFLVPCNENGIVADPNLVHDLDTALNVPFDFSEVFLYSHGWWTNAIGAMRDYNRFGIEFAKVVHELAAKAGAAPPALGVGIHWPSMLSEDDGAIINWLQAASFYTMEKRADNVGENAGYLIWRSLVESPRPPTRIHVIGHSFGCKVALASLQEIFEDRKTVKIPADCEINVVLLQAALDDNDLEKGEAYGDVVAGFPKMRMLVTTSEKDLALRNAYPAAQIINVFRDKKARVALGSAGPSDGVVAQFGDASHLDVDPHFDRASAVNAAKGHRLVVADLTALHADPKNPYDPDPFSGHHSDIFIPELYELIAGFLFLE